MPITKENASRLGKKGSRKGIPNKSTIEIKEAFQLLLSNNLEKLQNDLNEMKPSERFNAVIQLASYVLPKMKAIELKQPNEEDFKPIIISFTK